MVRIYIVIVLSLCVYIFLHSRWFRFLKRALRDGHSGSSKEKLTMFDVRRLLIKGEKALAIRVYCELFKVSAQEAVTAIEEIERSIQSKDFEF